MHLAVSGRSGPRQRSTRIGLVVAAVTVACVSVSCMETATGLHDLAVGLISGLSAGGLVLLASWHAQHTTPHAQERADSKGSHLAQTNTELAAACAAFEHALSHLAEWSDPLLHELASPRLGAILQETESLGQGKVVFASTESWRTAYERILRSDGLACYLSVAWRRTEDYWQDAPGRHSIELNYQLVRAGLAVERTIILNDYFWPLAASLPARVIWTWIEEQHRRGLLMRLVRESTVAAEPDLLCDFGLYGHRACGLLELDDQCQTVRFTLDFTTQSVESYRERWRRLLLYSQSFESLLDPRARPR